METTEDLIKTYESYKSISQRADAEMKRIREELNSRRIEAGQESMKVKVDDNGHVQLKEVNKILKNCDIKALELLFPEAYKQTVTQKTSTYLDIRRVK